MEPEVPSGRKRCGACLRRLARSSFHRCRDRRDGLSWWCKSCARKWKLSPAGRRALWKYHRSEKGKATRLRYERSATHSATRRAYLRSEAGRQACLRALQNQRNTRHGKRANRARSAVAYALKTGRLQKPSRCESCGKRDSKLDAHHHRGYARRHYLDVIWLCRSPCHARQHGKKSEITPTQVHI